MGRTALVAPAAVLALAATLGLSACAADVDPAEEAAEKGPAARPNYAVRMDSPSSNPADFQLVEDDDGIRIQTGPAGIAYRSGDAILSGDMHVQATFEQYDAPIGYREAFGLFVGGIDLEGEELEYTYLLVRTTGDYLVKRRIGEITETIADWTPHPSVHTVDAEGDRPVNTLGIDVFGGQVHFVVNGDVVHVEAASRVRPYGVAGVRVNHRLDVRVDNWILRETSDQS
jgi:hypothetical protein